MENITENWFEHPEFDITHLSERKNKLKIMLIREL